MTPVGGSPFVVLSVGNLSEASVPLARLRASNLTVVMIITVVVSVLFMVLLWRATRSLKQLTIAADQVGRGNLSPALPPSRGDEVGRLSAEPRRSTDRARPAVQHVRNGNGACAVANVLLVIKMLNATLTQD